jgi:nucleotide-binding universal stress UspA family protein
LLLEHRIVANEGYLSGDKARAGNEMITLSAGDQPSFKRVLVATDFAVFSEIVLSRALAIARRYNSKIYLVHVTPPEIYESAPRDILRSSVKRLREHMQGEMHHLIRASGLAKVRYRSFLEEGNVVEVLLRLVRKHAIDLLVIGTRRQRGLNRMPLGSVAERLFRQAPCPVLIVPLGVGDGVRTHRILYPTDLSPRSLQAARYALSWARHYRAKVILLHVVQAVHQLSVADLNHQRALVKKRLQESVRWKANLQVKVELEVEFGEPAHKINKAAAQWRVDLIVLALRSAKPSAAHLDEGTAYTVVRHAPCPVLAVRQ